MKKNTNAKFLSKKEQEALKEIKRRISSSFPVKYFILFGSRARGVNVPDSDIDLLIVIDLPLSRSDKYLISDEIFEVNLAYDTNFSMIVEEYNKWESELWSHLPLHRNIEKEGISV